MHVTRNTPPGAGCTVARASPVALATPLAPAIPTKRISKTPVSTRRTWTALPVQLNFRREEVARAREAVGDVGDALGWDSGHDGDAADRAVRAALLRDGQALHVLLTANADPPRAKKRAMSAMTAPGVIAG